MSDQKQEKLPSEWNTDVLFGLVRVHEALLEAMIQTHPDCERLYDQFDVRLKDAIECAKKSGRTRLEERATADKGAILLEMIRRRADRQIAAIE
ncbi:hypothetical protein EN871_16685 [bacterium M00.F.Ca.ET.228.01.1.1]|nr:hypothetical protein EN871_16685 [bacterium M00.F.Ca.ET.228.01.1.1]TGS00886.1 hypothetical protein EN834_16680 [bacterium M00.F.Ca.ET.191.01.1.1]TGU05271.1 hypothetical protein EN798_17500 [bacterium M00.F.Ca.ET.155.01.1.1]